MTTWLSRMGSRIAKTPFRVIGTFIASLVILGGVAGGVGAGFTNDVNLGDTDSQAASDLLTDRFDAVSGDAAQIVFYTSSAEDLLSASTEGEISSSLDEIANQQDVEGISPLQISDDGNTAFVNVLYSKKATDLSVAHLERLESALDEVDASGIETSMRGPVVDRWREREIPVGEVVGLLLAVVLVALMFRSVFATVVTMGSALLSLALGNSLLAVVSGFIDIPSVAPTIAIMLALGAGIDYALFMVARFRNRLRQGDTVPEAVANTNLSTGMSVLTAGAIVVISILGLYVTGIEVISRMGLAAALVVAVSAFSAVTLTPALLKIFGVRLLPRRERKSTGETGQRAVASSEGKLTGRIATTMTRRPWISAVASTVVLLGLAAPALNLQLGQPDDSNRPVGDTMRTAYDRLSDGFGPGFNGPLVVAVDLADVSDQTATLDELVSELDGTAGVDVVTPPQVNSAGTAAVITVIPESRPQDAETSELVRELREQTIPAALSGTEAKAYVGGQTATYDDLATKVRDSLGILVVTVILVSLVLLVFAFKSVLLPIASAFMNVLSILAAYGIVTLAFQTQAGADLIGVNPQPVVSFVPMLMFAIIFGLSMDYNVFLVSAVKEMKESGLSALEAVIAGIKRSGSLITVAAAIMTSVFIGFTFTNETEVKMIGLGLAAAVIIDVTIVRLVLTPGLLAILGERAWWIPRWLDKATGKGMLASH